MSHSRAARLLTAVLLSLAFGSAAAFAQAAPPEANYPTRPIRIVVPFTPGGTSDILARKVGQRLSDEFGQPVVIENRAGAGANIGAAFVAKSEPDGYTLLILSTAHAINATLYAKPSYDTVRDFAPIGLIATTSQVLVVDPSLPVKSVAEFVDYAKQRPNQLNYSTPGNGSQPHLSAVLFSQLTAISMTHVPFRGAAEAMTAVLGGQIQLTFATAPSAVPFVKSGQMRALVISTPKRLPALADVPTPAEAGVPGFEVAGWNGLVGPAGMPPSIVAKLNTALVRIVKETAMQQFLIEQGAEPQPTSPEEFARYIRSEVEKWAKVVAASGARVE